ncbi:hypothetical protein HII31_07058 [Pseudocercospora fuligena]|uniref:Fork-head domain-containing protein n=1 Tax=Pseudocercospora fuligena TaxID=685502 RepID=A0A8H6RK65_9PEZI|nr:hypothetical protein HII31_07058 [Pseudocercospora fuligena]
MVDSSTQTKETISDLDSSPFWKRIELRAEILNRIAPYQSQNRSPPFRTGIMIVMALVCIDKERLTEDEIHHWILRAFPYFNNQALDWYLDACKNVRVEDSFDPPSQEIIKDFPHAIRHFDLPLDEHTVPLSDPEYSISSAAARLALARSFEPTQKGKFPFLKLAPELRNRIYEMLFKYPSPGIGFLGYKIDRKPILLSRSNSDRSFADLQNMDPDGYVFPEAFHTTLAILRICKQVFKEAMPMFYSMNTFYFGSIGDLHRKIAKLPLTRAKHFRDIHLELDALERDGRPFEEVFSCLNSLWTS